ncbi:hypothetical protein JOQ06_015695 [Pogonophryne albipinna]|uniref:Uncharacterized protein n=1 Tax=Pogonophryne albipinna TaxID=1090488 RepID=A0AAD6ANC1_9TELE|nr:hypothetical protein JOQ06_015695 [Pogonophryne albipinna]
MQPVEAQKGVSTKSQLLDSLKVYLNNKSRLQPIIGLGSIIECVKAGTHNKEILFLCEVCVCQLNKADMRNHIMGSLHRYNYIKAWHPHLVSEWKEKSDLSKLAWPLMEMAKTLEGKEGPGDVQWLELEDAVYQRIATNSENDAVTLITILRDQQGETESLSESTSTQPEQDSPKSQRIVLLSKNRQGQISEVPETNLTIDVIKFTRRLENASPEPSLPSENRSSSLDGYTGTEPLIGLLRVVECRGEDGRTYCFLCHCCRIRANKNNIIDHLTGISHLINYLMETHPEQVEVILADINDDYQLLVSLAMEVEKEEGRGEMKVIKTPESLGIQLTGKSYHWCVKMMSNGRKHPDIQKPKRANKDQGMPEKCAVVLSQWPKSRSTKRKMRGVTNPVFKVSLPLTKGSLLLKRSPFIMDSLPVSSAFPHSPDSDLPESPEFHSEDREVDYDTESFAINPAEQSVQHQQDRHSGEGQAGPFMEPERNVTVTPYQQMDGHYNGNEYFNPSKDITRTTYQKVYGGNNYNTQQGSHVKSNKRVYEEWPNEGQQTQNDWSTPAVSHTQDWPSHNSVYRYEAGSTEQWYNPTPQSAVGPRIERCQEVSFDATQHYYQQQPPTQYMAQNHQSLQIGSAGQHCWSGDTAAHTDAARVQMHPHLGDPHAQNGSNAPVPGAQFEPRQVQTYMEFSVGHVKTASQNDATQPTAHQGIQAGYGMQSFPYNYNAGPWTNPYQHLPHQNSGGDDVGWGGSQSNAYMPPQQAQWYYGAQSEVNYRAAGLI